MHINRKPAEQVEVDWAGDPAHIIDPDTGEILDARIFGGCYDLQSVSIRRSLYRSETSVMDCSTRPHVPVLWRCCKDPRAGQLSRSLWIIIIKAGIIPRINAVYQEMAEHYGTAIIPARIRSPKDKPNAEGSVGNIYHMNPAALPMNSFFLSVSSIGNPAETGRFQPSPVPKERGEQV